MALDFNRRSHGKDYPAHARLLFELMGRYLQSATANKYLNKLLPFIQPKLIFYARSYHSE